MITIETGTPISNGMYVAYVEGPLKNFLKKELLMWVQNKWSYPSSDQNYRGQIYGWIGPLPALKIEEPTQIPMYASAIRGGDEWQFIDGPTNDLKKLMSYGGERGMYVVLLQNDKEHVALYRWNHNKNVWREL